MSDTKLHGIEIIEAKSAQELVELCRRLDSENRRLRIRFNDLREAIWKTAEATMGSIGEKGVREIWELIGDPI